MVCGVVTVLVVPHLGAGAFYLVYVRVDAGMAPDLAAVVAVLGALLGVILYPVTIWRQWRRKER